MIYKTYKLWDTLIELTISRYQQAGGISAGDAEHVRVGLWAALWLLRHGVRTEEEGGMYTLFGHLVYDMVEEGFLTEEDAEDADPTNIEWPPGRPAEIMACHAVMLGASGKTEIESQA